MERIPVFSVHSISPSTNKEYQVIHGRALNYVQTGNILNDMIGAILLRCSLEDHLTFADESSSVHPRTCSCSPT